MSGVRALYDVHGHFLPAMDDGCKTVEESLQALEMAQKQGVTAMFATPHYYPVETVGKFLERREAAADRLKEGLAQAEHAVPQIVLGAEVACRSGLSQDPELSKLCLGGTEYLLLELPWRGWGNETLREIRNITYTCGLIPVMAHLERYVRMVPWEMIQKVLEQDVLVQVNAESFLSFSGRQSIKKLMRHTPIHLLGADCHNLTGRAPNMGQAAAYMEKHKMEYILDDACELGEQILMQAREEYIVRPGA